MYRLFAKDWFGSRNKKKTLQMGLKFNKETELFCQTGQAK